MAGWNGKKKRKLRVGRGYHTPYCVGEQKRRIILFFLKNQTVIVLFFSVTNRRWISRRNLPWFHKIRWIPSFLSIAVN